MVKITITDSTDQNKAEFESNADESVATQAQEAGVPIPIGCGVGACRTCLGTVEQGLEWLDTEAVGPAQIPTEDNEVLTCICGVKPTAPPTSKVKICCQNL